MQVMRKRPDLALRNTTHGLSKLYRKEYRSWKDMRARCRNAKNKEYHNYGARGITICKSWESFANFFADMGKRPTEKHTLDRIDVNGNYEPSNCRWADVDTQSNNKRTTPKIELNGEKKTISQWSKQYGMLRSTVEYRIKKGMELSKALQNTDLRKSPIRGIS